MGWRSKAAIAGTVGILTVGGVNALHDVAEPESAQRGGPSVEELDDANQRQNDQHRDKMGDGVNDENRETLRPGERRGPQFKLRLP